MTVTGTMPSSRKIRSLGILVLVLGYGIWSYYDGWVNPKYLDPAQQGERLFNQTMAVVMAVLFVVLLVRLIVLLKTKVVVDQNGIHVNGKLAVAWSAVTRVDDRGLDKGLLGIYYQDNGEDKKFTLDSYKVTEFDAMIEVFGRQRPDLLALEDPASPAGGPPETKDRQPS